MTAISHRPSVEHSSPAALRSKRPTWRDPRLAVGIVLVCVSVLVGARVVGGSDDTVAVLSAAGPLAAGQRVSLDDVIVTRLRFADGDAAARYVGVGQLPESALLTRAVGAGELLPVAALATQSVSDLLELPLSVEAGRLPSGLRVGDVVDVWVTTEGAGAEKVLTEVAVLSTSRQSQAGVAGARQVLLGIPADLEESLAEVIAQVSTGSVLLTRRAG